MLSVRCQVELSKPRKEDSIVCENNGHCRTASLAVRRDGTGRLLKWSDSLLVEENVRGNVVYFYSKAACVWEKLHRLYSYTCNWWWNYTVYIDPSENGSHKIEGKAVSLQCLTSRPGHSLIEIKNCSSVESYLFKLVWYKKSSAKKELRAKETVNLLSCWSLLHSEVKMTWLYECLTLRWPCHTVSRTVPYIYDWSKKYQG